MVQVERIEFWILAGVVGWFLLLFALAAVVLAARSDEADARRRAAKVRRAPRKPRERKAKADEAKGVEGNVDQIVLPLSPLSTRKQTP